MNQPNTMIKPDCLADRVALVTGGGSGIGRATALALAGLGARVVVLGRRAEPLAETCAEAGSDSAGAPRITAVPCDLREFGDVDGALDRVMAEHGRIDLLVNNAGGQFRAPAEDLSANGFRAVTRLKLEAPWYLTTQVAARSMIPQRSGKVVSITMTPRRGMPGMAHSSAARAGVESLTRTLAMEWARYGIRLNAVAPGIVHTQAWERYGLDPDQVGKVVPLGRLQRPAEVAALIAFLMSPAGDYITGTTLVADGGIDLAGPAPVPTATPSA